jgi:hypothetical protein
MFPFAKKVGPRKGAEPLPPAGGLKASQTPPSRKGKKLRKAKGKPKAAKKGPNSGSENFSKVFD